MNAEEKQCSKCKRWLKLSLFSPNSHAKSGLASQCRACVREAARRWQKANPERFKASVKKWQQANPERFKASVKKWQQANPERFKASVGAAVKKYSKKEYDTNPEYRMLVLVRSKVYQWLQGRRKSASTEVLTGCDRAQFKAYIESRFEVGMSWDNHGEWELDHYVPCAAFDNTDAGHQRACFHYSNYRPAWKSENRSKSAKIPRQWDSDALIHVTGLEGDDRLRAIVIDGIIAGSGN